MTRARIYAISATILLSLSGVASAQSFKDRVFNSIGVSFLLDYKDLPLREGQVTRSRSNGAGQVQEVTFTGYYARASYSFVSFIYQLRFNVVESQNASLSVAAPLQVSPSFNFLSGAFGSSSATGAQYATGGASSFGMFSFCVPLFLQASYGMGSTYSTDKSVGFSIGLGVDQGWLPLVSIEDSGSDELSKYYIMPAANLGFRWFTRGGKPWEVNFRFNYSGSDSKSFTETSSTGDNTSEYTAYTLGFGFSVNMQYMIGY
jgi:hypothetical protein